MVSNTYIYRQIVGPTLFYLSCLRPNLNNIQYNIFSPPNGLKDGCLSMERSEMVFNGDLTFLARDNMIRR